MSLMIGNRLIYLESADQEDSSDEDAKRHSSCDGCKHVWR